MSGLMEILAQQLGGGLTPQLSQQIGADQHSTGRALSAALPVLMGALARNASTPQGAESLDRALERHDGSLLDNLGGFLGNPQAARSDGDAILRHVLGGKRSQVETGISRASGLDTAQVAQLISTLAPMVLGLLGRERRKQGLDSAGLASVLGSERQAVESDRGAAGMLGALLDQDGDGQVADDVTEMGMKFLGGLLGGRR